MTTARRVTDDVDLVSRARSGEVGAFCDLVQAHRLDWDRLALRLLGDSEEAAEVTQEATLRMWRGIGRFRGDAAFTTWAHRIVVNAAWTQRRKAKRHATTSIDLVDDPLHDPFEFHADRLGIRADVSSALSSLSYANRTVVILKDVYGWSHAEVAEALGITVTAAKVRLHRGRTALRSRLEPTL